MITRRRRSLVTLTVLFTALVTVGCTGSNEKAEAAPEPNLATFLHPNYRVVSVTTAPLSGNESAPDRIVISTGPGLDPKKPVEGGTRDLQVLSYDQIAKRWNLTFDAANDVVAASLRPYRLPDDSLDATALLDQSKSYASLTAQPVTFSAGAPKLVVYAGTTDPEAPAGEVSVVGVSNGNATVDYYDTAIAMTPPKPVGTAPTQTVTVTAKYIANGNGPCCPVRLYTQSIGATPAASSATPIGVVADDRGWLGAYFAAPEDSADPLVVVGTAAGSPASNVLNKGDKVTGVVGGKRLADANVLSPILDEMAVGKPSEKVVLEVTRDGERQTIPVTLGNRVSAAFTDATEPALGALGIGGNDAPAGSTAGAYVNTVNPGGPADQAGIVPTDTVTAAGSIKVRSVADLQVALVGTVGKSISVTVVHGDGARSTLSVAPAAADTSSVNALTLVAV